AGTGPMLDPTWSLAVEEQFYVVWPWIALRVRRETVVKICCAVVMMSPVIRIAMRVAGASGEFVYANTLCRMDGIAMGGALAAWVRNERCDVERLRRFALAGVAAGVIGTALCFGMTSASPATELRFSFVTITFGCVMAWILARQGTGSFVAQSLRSFALTRLGRISFGLYLFNLPIYTVMHGHLADRVFFGLPSGMAEFSRVLAANLLLLTIAAVSWRFYESPILRLKVKMAPR
ncbi:MAG TPA: acyltransferase, partial [Terriglobales bacterium]|nr:acyltransferase [Terriglobales bacterium]